MGVCDRDIKRLAFVKRFVRCLTLNSLISVRTSSCAHLGRYKRQMQLTLCVSWSLVYSYKWSSKKQRIVHTAVESKILNINRIKNPNGRVILTSGHNHSWNLNYIKTSISLFLRILFCTNFPCRVNSIVN